MKTLRLLLAQAAVVCAVGAIGEVRVDTELPAGCVIVQGIEGDTVKLEHDFRTTQGGWFYWAFRVTGAEGRTLKFQFDKKYWAAGEQYRAEGIVDIEKIGLAYCKNRVELCR